MAGDWLKMELCLPNKPEILAMSAKTGMEPDLIVGKCFRLWSWFDQHTKEGNAAGVTLVTLSYAIGNGDANIAFLDALKSVGWIVEDEQGISLPNFDRHNGETAKTRALTAKRVAKHKSKSNAESNGDSVTCSVNSALPREEKRREEVNTIAPSGFDEFWSAYPKKVGKGAAESAWKKHKPILAVVLAAIASQKNSDQWRKDSGQFIPNPATWLNQKRWEDGVSSESSSDPDELITLPNGQQITRKRQQWLLEMTR